jgi:hypothetical protein
LKKENYGFSFIIKNNLANGTIIEVYSLKLDDIEAKFDEVAIKINEEVRPTDTVSSKNPIMLTKGVNTIFQVNMPITDGDHKIELHFKTKEVGSMKFDFSDTIN